VGAVFGFDYHSDIGVAGERNSLVDGLERDHGRSAMQAQEDAARGVAAWVALLPGLEGLAQRCKQLFEFPHPPHFVRLVS
jgi:hypothetical protein